MTEWHFLKHKYLSVREQAKSSRYSLPITCRYSARIAVILAAFLIICAYLRFHIPAHESRSFAFVCIFLCGATAGQKLGSEDDQAGVFNGSV